MKRCSFCKKIKDPSEFYKDAKRKDGLQALCKECKKARYKERAEGNVTPREAVKRHKLLKIADGIASGKNLQEAYHALGTTKSLKVASSSVTTFNNSLDDKDRAVFRNTLMCPPILNAISCFFIDVFTKKIETTVDEYNKTIDRWAKLTGTFIPDKVQSTSNEVSVSEKLSERELMKEEVGRLLEKQRELIMSPKEEEC